MSLRDHLLRLELESHQLPGDERRKRQFYKLLFLYLGICIMVIQLFKE